MADAPSPAGIDPTRVLAARDEVLKLPEFQVERDLQARLWDWFIGSLEDIASYLPGVVSVLALVLGLTALAALAWWLVRPIWARQPRTTAAVFPGQVTGAFAGLRAAALTALGEGRLADAVRTAWLAALALLDERGVSRRRLTRTDWEHVAVARRARTALADPLEALATLFQRSHFGGRPLERAEAEACLHQLDQLAALAATPETIQGG